MKKEEKQKNEKYTVIRFTADKYDNLKTVGSVMKKNGVSLSLMRSLKHYEHGIMLDGEDTVTVNPVRCGQVIELRIPCDKKTAVPSEIECETVYEDDYVIVFNKPAGMAIHPVKQYRTDTLANAFARHMQSKGKSLAFRPINRLDKDTSGLAVAALDRHSASKLSGKIDKTYYAICGGKPPDFGKIDAPLGRKEGFGITQCVREDGASAVTYYETVMSNGEYSLVKVKIDTGRLHQIRAHFAHIGHPLVGDCMYGGDTEILSRQALHCGEVSFEHPISGRLIGLSSDMPEDMRKIMLQIFGTEQI